MVVKKVPKPADHEGDLVTGTLRQWWKDLNDRYFRFVYPTLSTSDQYFRA